MKNLTKILAFLLTLLFASTANALIQDRLQPITSGQVNMAVDTFIIGTEDYYIVTTAREVIPDLVADFNYGMTEMVTQWGAENLLLVERQIFERHAKRIAVVERGLVLRSDMQSSVATEPLTGGDFEEAQPGSVEEIIWDQVAGPNGLAMRILGEYPEPVELTEDYKIPVDTQRYAIAGRGTIGGIYLDRTSVQKTEMGCSVLVVEAFNFDSELGMGSVASQTSGMPHVDAHYSVALHEYDFEKVACVQHNYFLFSREGKVIYAVRHPEPIWHLADEGTHPSLAFEIMALRQNLPEDVALALADDIAKFDEYVLKKIEEQIEAGPDALADPYEESDL